jgi:cell division GTPase FtsZ
MSINDPNDPNQQDDTYINPSDGDDTYINPEPDDDFGFLGNYDDDVVTQDERMLPENTARAAISCGFIGVGGGGGKLAKAFLDLGFNKTVLVNTTVKDQPNGIDPSHFLLLPGADGVGKDVALGKKVLEDNSALVEDTLRTRIGKVDWLFVLAGGGGGTGSACHALHESLTRYLSSQESPGKVVYIVSKPTAQELLNPTIGSNFKTLLEEVSSHPHLLIDNEKQLQLLRGKVGMLNMYPAANSTFAKLFHQVLKLADESSPIQTFDTKDLERCLRTDGRMFVGSTVVRDVNDMNLGATVFQGCLRGSPCPAPSRNPETGVLLLLVTSTMASNPDVSNRLESAFSYVGGRTKTLFSGVYINDRIPGLIGISLFGGMK